MSRRRIFRRARTSVLTFVSISVLAHWMIPSLWAWGVASDLHEEALQRVLSETGRAGEEEALKDELWKQWNDEKENSTGAREYPDIIQRFEKKVGALWGVSFLIGLVAGGLVWIPTAPKHLVRHHRHSHHHRSRARHGSAIH